MTPREIVKRTITFDYPQRLAQSFDPSDFRHCGPATSTHATPWQRVSDSKWERYDEWGNLWSRIDETSKGEVERGVLDSIDAIAHYQFPDYSNPDDYDSVRQARQEFPDRYLLGGLPGYAFNIARKMRRLDQYLMDLLLEPERMHELHDRIDAMLADMIRNYAAAGVDAIMFPEDWGTQQQTLISPDLWHEEFFPRFERLNRLAHESGISVFMHSCGKIEAIVPGLITSGIDVLQFDQPDLHGIDQLASYQETAHITFWCPVDIQRCLQTRDEQCIRNKAREMVGKLWRGRGGFIGGYYGDNASIGLEPRWQEIASAAFQDAAAHYKSDCVPSVP